MPPKIDPPGEVYPCLANCYSLNNVSWIAYLFGSAQVQSSVLRTPYDSSTYSHPTPNTASPKNLTVHKALVESVFRVSTSALDLPVLLSHPLKKWQRTFRLTPANIGPRRETGDYLRIIRHGARSHELPAVSVYGGLEILRPIGA